MLLFNACHAGEVSPSLGAGEGPTLGSVSLPAKAGEALLATGEGRILITACRPDQKSWIGAGELSIFTQALVDGLRGEGYVPNQGGYISAFGLYEHMYRTIRDAAAGLGQTQEPELTVLRGVGPFPVALYRGATDLGSFDSSAAPPEGTAARQVDPARSERLLQQIITSYNAELRGSGAIAQGPGAKAVGEGGTLIEGDIDTGGGAAIFGGVDTGGGDFVGRDKIGGDKISLGDVGSGSAVAAGRGARASATSGPSGEQLEALFAPLFAALRQTPGVGQAEALRQAEALKEEAAKGGQADDARMAGLIEGLVELAPAAAGALAGAFGSPVLGGLAGPVTKFVVGRLRGK
jgi:hypothetical protein